MWETSLSKDYKVKGALYSVLLKPTSYTTNNGAFNIPAFKFEKCCNSTLSYHHFESITVRPVTLPITATFAFYDAETLQLLYIEGFNLSNTNNTIQLNQDILQVI